MNSKGKAGHHYAFSLLEVSIVIVMLSLILAAILVSKILIISAKINQVQKDFRDIDVLTQIFTNSFGCIPGDCNIKDLPINIYTKVPSGCFNLDSDYLTPLSVPIITTGLNTGEIDSAAKRTCAFYEMQALEPQAFSGHATEPPLASKINNIIGINTALAIGTGLLRLINNPLIAYSNQSQIDSLNSQINANNVIIANNNVAIGANNVIIASNTTVINSNNTTISNNNSIIQSCDQYKNSVSTTPYAPDSGYLGSYGFSTFFTTLSVNDSPTGLDQNGFFVFSFYVPSITGKTFNLQLAVDSNADYTINSATHSPSYSDSQDSYVTSSFFNNIPLHQGINIIRLDYGNRFNVQRSGVAAEIKDNTGAVIWNTKTSSSTIGTNPFTGCGSDTTGFCGSTCRANLGNSSTLMGGYNATILPIITQNTNLTNNNTTLNSQNTGLTNTNNTLTLQNNTLTASNNNLQQQINALNDINQYITLSIPTATQPVIKE